MNQRNFFLTVLLASFILPVCVGQTNMTGGTEKNTAGLLLDESPVQPGEWGYQPTDGRQVPVSPPSFVWRPMPNIARWELVVEEATKQEAFYHVEHCTFNTHTPPVVFQSGNYSWKYRGFDKDGTPTNWSQTRTFEVPRSARPMPLPERNELLKRIPSQHPRIFVRPEGMSRLRELAKNELNAEYQELVKLCENLLKDPPDTTEPPIVKEGGFRASETNLWWGNRLRTINVLENAAMLAFVWNLDGNEAYAKLSKRLLMDVAAWDPKGTSGFRFYDEVGMPYNYHFSRTYTFLNSYLNEEEKQRCRELMKIRGKEMYDFLFPQGERFSERSGERLVLWYPYNSHDNRAWHFLGEIGLAFYGEIPEAADWIWSAMNKFYSSYPVWSDDDGGWHEGLSYWQEYQIRFCWWADAMKAAFGINAFDKPYYSQIGYLPLYLTPPGKSGTLFGDLCTTEGRIKSEVYLELVDILAIQSGNPHWRWFVDVHKNLNPPSYYTANYYKFIRKATSLDSEPVKALPPTDLPTARWFRGTGQTVMNTNLLDGTDNVQVLFKSAPAPFGTYSHGQESQNSFIFSAWNEDLLINTGRRDNWGSLHHMGWMWSTRSVNNITVDGIGQPHGYEAVGQIVQFENHPAYDIVVGDAPDAYYAPKNNVDYPDGKVLEQYRRSIVFFKPNLLIVYDKLKAVRPATFEYWLHAKKPFQPLELWFPGGKSAANDKLFATWLDKTFKQTPITDSAAVALVEPLKELRNLGIRVDKVACRLDMLIPEKLEISQTNQYDPNPQLPSMDNIREWHVVAKTTEKKPDAEFLLVVRPWKVAAAEAIPKTDLSWERKGNEIVVTAVVDGKVWTVRFGGDEVTVLPN